MKRINDKTGRFAYRPFYDDGEPRVYAYACRRSLASKYFARRLTFAVTCAIISDERMKNMSNEITMSLNDGGAVVVNSENSPLLFATAARALLVCMDGVQPLSLLGEDDPRSLRSEMDELASSVARIIAFVGDVELLPFSPDTLDEQVQKLQESVQGAGRRISVLESNFNHEQARK